MTRPRCIVAIVCLALLPSAAVADWIAPVFEQPWNGSTTVYSVYNPILRSDTTRYWDNVRLDAELGDSVRVAGFSATAFFNPSFPAVQLFLEIRASNAKGLPDMVADPLLAMTLPTTEVTWSPLDGAPRTSSGVIAWNNNYVRTLTWTVPDDLDLVLPTDRTLWVSYGAIYRDYTKYYLGGLTGSGGNDQKYVGGASNITYGDLAFSLLGVVPEPVLTPALPAAALLLRRRRRRAA